jgi:hypothetical protein
VFLPTWYRHCSLLIAPALHLQVKAAAATAGTATFKLVGNRDIEHILDDLLHCVARPAEVPDVVSKLSATTFVQVGLRDALLCACQACLLCGLH